MENKKIKTIFAGTPNISVPLLRKLFEDERFDINLVITQIDKPAGRKMELVLSPVKSIAEKKEVPVFQPEDINTPESIQKISRFNPDIIIVMAYGQILSKEILEIPKYGCLNVHASVLPKYRGASPVQSALLNRENETGISLMQMEEKMDSGPVYKNFKIAIESDDNSITLTEKLAHLASQNVPDAIINIINNRPSPVPQNETKATYCKRILKTDGLINWDDDAEFIDAKIKAYAGWPSTYTFWGEKRLKILEASIIKKEVPYEHGKVIKEGNEILISAKNGLIKPIHIQMEGKNPQSIRDFINGNPNFINSKLSSTS